MFNKKKSIKCPRCHYNNSVLMYDDITQCQRCHLSFSDLNTQQTLIHANNHVSFRANLLVIIIVLLFILLFLYNFYSEIRLHDAIKSYQSSNKILNNTDDFISTSLENTKDNISDNSYKLSARTAFILFPDANQEINYLYKATFVTQSEEQDDAKAVLIKQDNQHYKGYDADSGTEIPNFERLVSSPFAIDAMILYSDNNNVIIKNKINNYPQLELVDGYTGQIRWTISHQEIPEIEKITATNASESDLKLSLYNNDFKIQIASNYYLVNKTGEIIDAGKVEDLIDSE